MTPIRQLVETLVQATWPAGVPSGIEALLDRELLERHLDRGKFCPVFPLLSERRVRARISDLGDPLGWSVALRERFPHPDLAGFLAGAPDGARRWVDTDGRTARVAQAGLDRVDPVPPGPQGLPLTRAEMVLPDGVRELVTVHVDAPWDYLAEGVLLEGLEELEGVGAVGSYGLRWREDEVVALLWRPRGSVDDARAIAAELGSHAALEACMDAACAAGLTPYPRVLELLEDGSWDHVVAFR